MKILIIIFALFITIICSNASGPIPRLHDEYDPAKWPDVKLKLSQAATLKDIFDSGLRPYRHPGLEDTLLEVKHLNLRILLGSGKKLPSIPIEWMNFKVFTDGELAFIEASTPSLTFRQAREEMLNWMPYSDAQISEIDLDNYLEILKSESTGLENTIGTNPHEFSVKWKEPGWGEPAGGAQATAWFRKSPSTTHPLKMYIKFSWGLNRPMRERVTHWPHPIDPPTGYEDVDMTAPAKFGPNSMVDILRSKGVDIGDGKGGMPQDAYSSSIEGVRREVEKSSQQPYDGVGYTTEKSGNNFPWLSLLWIGVLLLLLGLLFQLLKTRFAAE